MKLKPIIPADVDPIALADEIKKGLTDKFLSDLAKLRKTKPLLAR